MRGDDEKRKQQQETVKLTGEENFYWVENFSFQYMINMWMEE